LLHADAKERIRAASRVSKLGVTLAFIGLGLIRTITLRRWPPAPPFLRVAFPGGQVYELTFLTVCAIIAIPCGLALGIGGWVQHRRLIRRATADPETAGIFDSSVEW